MNWPRAIIPASYLQKFEWSSSIHLCLLLLLLFDEFALDEDLHLIADDPLAIEHHVKCQAKIFAIDFSFCTVTDSMAHHIRVIEFTVFHDLQCNRMGIALDSQITGHIVSILSCC